MMGGMEVNSSERSIQQVACAHAGSAVAAGGQDAAAKRVITLRL